MIIAELKLSIHTTLIRIKLLDTRIRLSRMLSKNKMISFSKKLSMSIIDVMLVFKMHKSHEFPLITTFSTSKNKWTQ